MNGRLYRSNTDRVFAGLCGGLADHFDLEPGLVRLGWVVLDVFSGIVPLLLVYIVMAIVVPEEPPVGAQAPWASPTALPWGPGTPAGAATPGRTGSASDQPEGAPPSPPGGEPGGSQPGAPGTGDEQAGGSWGPWGPPPPIGSDWRTVRAYARAQRRAQRAYWRSQRWGGQSSTAGLIVGLILVLVGGAALLAQAVPAFNTDVLWPLVLIVIGTVILVGAFRR